jgi:hypothetical protein
MGATFAKPGSLILFLFAFNFKGKIYKCYSTFFIKSTYSLNFLNPCEKT